MAQRDDNARDHRVPVLIQELDGLSFLLLGRRSRRNAVEPAVHGLLAVSPWSSLKT